MSAEQAFHLTHCAGRLALRRSDLGAIKVGAKADLVVSRTDSPNIIGATDPLALIILHSDVGNIEDRLVGGKVCQAEREAGASGIPTHNCGVRGAREKDSRNLGPD
jgi:cytosine/adenosine deaminase-related metal-dependent hydrolase